MHISHYFEGHCMMYDEGIADIRVIVSDILEKLDNVIAYIWHWNYFHYNVTIGKKCLKSSTTGKFNEISVRTFLAVVSKQETQNLKVSAHYVQYQFWKNYRGW